MYNPLVKLKHESGNATFIRASLIIRAEKWEEKKVYCLNDEGKLIWYKNIVNIDAVVELINSIENRNELSNYMKS